MRQINQISKTAFIKQKKKLHVREKITREGKNFKGHKEAHTSNFRWNAPRYVIKIGKYSSF